MEFIDVTGKPESVENLKDALKFLNEQVVRNPLATTKEGIPYVLHFTVIRRGLQELISIRERVYDVDDLLKRARQIHRTDSREIIEELVAVLESDRAKLAEVESEIKK